MIIDRKSVKVEIGGARLVLDFTLRSEDARPEPYRAYPSYLDRYADPDFFKVAKTKQARA